MHLNIKHCMLNIESHFLLSTGNHTISVVKCKEDYDTLKTSLKNVIQEVNSLSREGSLEVEGKKLRVELYLGGDYKVQKCMPTLILGMLQYVS